MKKGKENRNEFSRRIQVKRDNLKEKETFKENGI